MRALTLIEPWGWAIAHAGKRFEHRTWAPWRSVVHHMIAIHAGKSFDESAAQMIERKIGIEVPRNSPLGIIGVARVMGCVWGEEEGRPVSTFDLSVKHALSHADPRWYGGGLAWVLDDVIALPNPIPCRGAQGLWAVPAEHVDNMRYQLGIVL